MRGTPEFIGIGNYVQLYNNADFMESLGNTIWFMVMNVMLSISVALMLALFLHRNTRINSFITTLSFTPNVIPLVSVSILWMWLMNKDSGLLNIILSWFGIASVGWLSDPNVALFSLVLVSVWKSVGYNSLLIMSALAAVPVHLYDAARLDNASKTSILVNITLKMISPTIFFLTIINIIASFQVFDSINIMTQGGPNNATNTLVFGIYKQGFEYYRVGYSAAMSVILMVIIGLLTIVYFKMLSKRVHYR